MTNKYEIVGMLTEYGLKPSQIAISLYNVEWEKLPLEERRKLINRIIALRHYREKRIYDKRRVEFMTNNVYDDRIDDHGGVRDISQQWHYSRNGTADIVERKKYATTPEEKYFAEYERLLYFFYERTLYEYDDLSRTMWNRIIIVHRKIFSEYWKQYGKKFSFNKKPAIPEIVAAYVYISFFAAFYHHGIFFDIRGKLNKLLSAFVRDPNKYRNYIRELLPLIADFI